MNRPQLLECLSETLLRLPSNVLWRKIFLEAGQDTVRFDVQHLTILRADAPDARWTELESERFANRYAGSHQPGQDGQCVLSFPDARCAVRAAVAWQRLSGSAPIRVSVSTHRCSTATVAVDAHQRSFILSGLPQVPVAAGAAGSISLCPGTYALVRRHIHDEIALGIVATELDDDAVTRATITLAPHPAAAASTFAGLGRM